MNWPFPPVEVVTFELKPVSPTLPPCPAVGGMGGGTPTEPGACIGIGELPSAGIGGLGAELGADRPTAGGKRSPAMGRGGSSDD